ncbi:hypothetical protein IW261DRAFT_1421328 [Armillaria novae-zelandiae]|uniref:Uncharacterized protein n=1 Tax=Armillaria novae-zelandiae TaxID=153914 RepID=A0AA39P4G2_9AGAR|nr:hypothetical protein IW261DRAFT_1421328 [Armillaria novae-zelandiae]
MVDSMWYIVSGSRYKDLLLKLVAEGLEEEGDGADFACDADRKCFERVWGDILRGFEHNFAVSAEFIIQDFKYAIIDLNTAVGCESDASIFVPNRRVIVDSTSRLRRSLDRLVRSPELRFSLLAMDVHSLLEVVSRVHTHGQRIFKELEAEINRVREAYENIPLWQSVTPIEILDEGTQRRVSTSYYDFPSRACGNNL